MGRAACATLLFTFLVLGPGRLAARTWLPGFVSGRGRNAPTRLPSLGARSTRSRLGRLCQGDDQGAALSAAAGENSWRDDPKKALREALSRADAEWAILQVQAETEAEPSQAAAKARSARAAEVLGASALDRLRPFVVPSEYIDIPPLRGGEDALEAFLSEDAGLVTNFLSQSGSLGKAGMVFWQAELYLRRFQETPGEESVEDAVKSAGEQLDAESQDFRETLRGSVLLARQNFISAARFGYFLRRSQQRWQLEQSMGGGAFEDDADDGFLAALQRKSREAMAFGGGVGGGGFNARRSPRTLEEYLETLPSEQAVELVRVASHEASLALEQRATSLYGSEADLLEEFERSAASGSAVSQLTLSPEARLRLSIEASAFGAALFEAEEVAARRYELGYTEFGSRADGPLG